MVTQSARTRRPNPHTPAGERILDTAVGLFYAHGIRAIGVDVIADEAGTTKKTLYDRFGSKDELVAAYLRRRRDRWLEFFDPWLEGSARTGETRVLDVYDAAEAWSAEHDRGCAFVNAHAEIGGLDHPGNAVILEDKVSMRELFVGMLREAGRDDADEIGGQLHLLYEGAIVAQTVAGRPDAFETARGAARMLLGADRSSA